MILMKIEKDHVFELCDYCSQKYHVRQFIEYFFSQKFLIADMKELRWIHMFSFSFFLQKISFL
ncbi:Uncharacterised protein [Candidatus Venteria ishoeyi]|uniref:Uncharacterized protein n=1 Tax=Candidatus Venteria ishoeyi TaxID=1899563 RepID=A0A1H6F4S6_9GAMM|nr:Uncharacterised protein [Candidatus Venteria ishoeyi]